MDKRVYYTRQMDKINRSLAILEKEKQSIKSKILDIDIADGLTEKQVDEIRGKGLLVSFYSDIKKGKENLKQVEELKQQTTKKKIKRKIYPTIKPKGEEK